MPRLLSLPLSELFTESSGAASAEYFPSPWHGAPLPIALKARQLAEDAALFSGAPAVGMYWSAEQKMTTRLSSQSSSSLLSLRPTLYCRTQTKRCRWLTALPEKHPAAPLKKLPALWKS